MLNPCHDGKASQKTPKAEPRWYWNGFCFVFVVVDVAGAVDVAIDIDFFNNVSCFVLPFLVISKVFEQGINLVFFFFFPLSVLYDPGSEND